MGIAYNSHMKIFDVYVPCIYSEHYVVEAYSPEEALTKVQFGEGECQGETITGKEAMGFRVIERNKDVKPSNE